jgi:hypothetical protein
MKYKRAIPFNVWVLVLCGAAGQTKPIQTEAPKPVKVESGLLQGAMSGSRRIPCIGDPQAFIVRDPNRAAPLTILRVTRQSTARRVLLGRCLGATVR